MTDAFAASQVKKLGEVVVPATYAEVSAHVQHTAAATSVLAEMEAFDELVKREGLRTEGQMVSSVQVAAAPRATGTTTKVTSAVASVSAALDETKAETAQTQQREALLRDSYLDRLFQESVETIVEATVAEAAPKEPVTICAKCDSSLWIYGRAHPAFVRIGLPPEGTVWPCAVCRTEFGGGNSLFVCATPEKCAWRVCQTCHDGVTATTGASESPAAGGKSQSCMLLADRGSTQESSVLWERLDAAHTEAAAVAAATTSAVAQIGASQPRAIPRVTGISKRKQRQLELNRRLGFVVDDIADEAGEPTIMDSGYGSRRRPMPLGTKRKYKVYEYAPDSTGLSKLTQPRIRALGRLQVRVNIIGHARIIYVGKSQSCMV